MTNSGNYQVIATTAYGGRAEWNGVKGQTDNGQHVVSKRADVPLISIIKEEIVSDEGDVNDAQTSDENPDDTIDKVNNTENISTKSDAQDDDEGDVDNTTDGDDVAITDDNEDAAKDDSQPDNSSDANGVGDVSSDANESSDSIENSADLGSVVNRPDSPPIQPVNGQIESVFNGASGVNVDNQSQLSILINDG